MVQSTFTRQPVWMIFQREIYSMHLYRCNWVSFLDWHHEFGSRGKDNTVHISDIWKHRERWCITASSTNAAYSDNIWSFNRLKIRSKIRIRAFYNTLRSAFKKRVMLPPLFCLPQLILLVALTPMATSPHRSLLTCNCSLFTRESQMLSSISPCFRTCVSESNASTIKTGSRFNGTTVLETHIIQNVFRMERHKAMHVNYNIDE